MKDIHTQLVELTENIKRYLMKVGAGIVAFSLCVAILICVNDELASKVLAFKTVAVADCEGQKNEYVVSYDEKEDYKTLKNRVVYEELMAEKEAKAALAKASAADATEEATASVEPTETRTVATAAPIYVDPATGYELVGTFMITAYCPCAKCCGKTNGITACGLPATANHTIAADTRLFPFGTQLVIGGQVYTVEDRGSAIQGNRIDIFCATHQEALSFGRRYIQVFRYVPKPEPAPEEPTTEEPTTEEPTTEEPTTEEPTTEEPTTEEPSTEVIEVVEPIAE